MARIGSICLLVVLAGCGRSAATAHPRKQPVATATSTVTSTQATIDTPTAEPSLPSPTLGKDTATPTPRATVAATPTAGVTIVPAPAPARLTYAELRPDNVLPGGTLHGSVRTSGRVSAVTMFIGSGVPTAAGLRSYNLAEASPGTWVMTAAAPTAPGNYHFTVALTDASGHRLFLDNDNWNVTVIGAGKPVTSPTSVAVQAVPPDVPLSPPFAWGAPVAATFSAEGKTINGSEVSTNTRSDVPPSAVAQFYEIRLPRSGWTLDQSTIPSASARAWTIVATIGTRVCVVEFGAGTAHVFYGTS